MDSREALETRLAAVEQEIATDKELVDQLEAAMVTDAPPPSDVEDLYREAGAPLPGLAERKRVCESLRTRLRLQSKSVQVRLGTREEERDELKRRLAQMRFGLSPSEAVPSPMSSVLVRP